MDEYIPMLAIPLLVVALGLIVYFFDRNDKAKYPKLPYRVKTPHGDLGPFCQCGKPLRYIRRPAEYDLISGKPTRYVIEITCEDFLWSGNKCYEVVRVQVSALERA